MIDVFLVDDDDINNFLLKHLITKSEFGVNLKTFNNPVEAVTRIKNHHNHNCKIDLLLLDINMPSMSGWDVLDELRMSGESIIECSKIYMLSSSIYSSDMEQAENYKEVSGFISKPIGLEQLTNIFKEITISKREEV